MFRGEFAHSLDQKGRMIVPAKFNDTLGERFIITKGLDRCLFIFGMHEWQEYEEKVRKLPLTDEGVRRFVRFFFGSAYEAEPDPQRRTLIPVHLREYANLAKDIVSVGVPDRIEVWSKENWTNYNQSENFVDKELSAQITALGI